MADEDDWLAKWEARWGEADFTWEGLSKHKLQGWVVAGGLLREAASGRVYGQPVEAALELLEGAPATLQDYWRADPATGRLRDDAAMNAELVTRPHQPTYHLAHLPLTYEDRTETGKRHWADDALETIVSPRLLAADETQWKGSTIVGPDRAAQFQGGVWMRAPRHPKGESYDLCLRMDLALIARPCDFAKARFRSVRFQGAAFSDDTWFDGATLKGVAWFDGAAFGGVAGFKHAVFKATVGFRRVAFEGDAWFQHALFHRDGAIFEGGTFRGVVGLKNAVFEGNAKFDGAVFRGDAGFKRVVFRGEALFKNARFGGVAAFEDAMFSRAARFQGAVFVGAGKFKNTTCGAPAEFEGATFKSIARFERTKFSVAGFQRVTFNGDAWFEGAVFRVAALYKQAKFCGSAKFERAEFGGAARFEICVFESEAHFDRAQFLGDMDFISATFEKLASFERIQWPEAVAHWHSAFDRVLFRGTLSLSGAGFQRFAAFDSATIERDLQMDEVSESEASARFGFELEQAKCAAEAEERRPDLFRRLAWWWASWRSWRKARISRPKRERTLVLFPQAPWITARQIRLGQLERSCRVLKFTFARAANKSREQMLYRFELQARRAQSGLPPGEALFSDLYRVTSDYGASMVRPFIALSFIVVAFGLVFFGWAWALGFVAKATALGQAAQALEFSLTNTFRPLSALSADSLRTGTVGARLLAHSDLSALGVRSLCILQSLLAIVHAFLFALAVRRRFQIS